MSRAKTIAGLLVAVGFTAGWGLILAALAVGYAHQHVHDRTANILNDHTAIVHVNDFTHSTAGIIAVSGVCLLAFVLGALAFVLAGGGMISARDRSWE